MVNINKAHRGVSVEYAFLSVDLSNHTNLFEENGPRFAKVRKAFKKFATEKVNKRGGALHSWEGDGGIFAFWGGTDFTQKAVLSGLQILADMLTFNIEHNPFDQFIDLKIGIHTGNAIATKIPGDWAGNGLNQAGHFFKQCLVPGVIVISARTYKPLSPKLKERFHRGRKVENFQTYECGRHILDPQPSVFVKFLDANRIIEILNEQGDAKVIHRAELVNTHPNRELDHLDVEFACPEQKMSWKDCEIKAWSENDNQSLNILQLFNNPYHKRIRINIPTLMPDSEPIVIGYSLKWAGLLPKSGEYWITGIGYPTDRLSLRIIFPDCLAPEENSVRVCELSRSKPDRLIPDISTLTTADASASKHTEIEMKLIRPALYTKYQLSWHTVD